MSWYRTRPYIGDTAPVVDARSAAYNVLWIDTTANKIKRLSSMNPDVWTVLAESWIAFDQATAGLQATAQKGAADGYAALDAGTKVPIAQVPTGTTSTTTCIGNDSRLSDARTPTAHATSHKSAGSDPVRLDELASPTASVQINQQQALQFRLENRTSDPVSPAAGEIWLRTDL